MTDADVRVYFDFGGSDNSPGTSQDITALGPPTLRMKTNDDANIDFIDTILVPSSGTNNSYWKQVYVKIENINDSVQVNNVKFYTDGSGFGTGITLNVGDETPTKNSGSSAGYDVATGTAGDSGDVMTDHTDITGVTDAFTYTSASPKTISISESGSVMNATGETSDYLVLQMVVASTATAQNLVDEVFSFQYDLV